MIQERLHTNFDETKKINIYDLYGKMDENYILIEIYYDEFIEVEYCQWTGVFYQYEMIQMMI